MSLKLKQALLNVLTDTAESIEEQALEAVLRGIKNENAEEFRIISDGIVLVTGKLSPKVTSKFLKAMLQGLNDAVNDASQDEVPAP
jgi:uncharacterized protein involved in exopolysaccharide biosynthesis